MHYKKFYFILFFFISIGMLFSNDSAQINKLRQNYKFDEAISMIKDINLNDPETSQLLARLYLDKGDYEKASELYSVLCPSFNSLECWNESGIALFQLGKYEKAESHFKKALSLKDNSAATISNLAVVYNALNKHHDADLLYQKAIQLEEYNPVFHVNYAVFQIGQKQYYAALQILQKIVKDYPGLFYAHLYLGVTHYYRKEFKSALNHLRKGIEYNPNYYDLYYYKALVFYRTGDYINAIDDLNRLDELFPDSEKSAVLRKMIQRSLR